MFLYQKAVTERMIIMPEEKGIIEKITELLYRERLITLEEKTKAAQLIREGAMK